MGLNARDKVIVNLVAKIIRPALGDKATERIVGFIVSTGAAAKLYTKVKDIIGDVKSGVFTDFINWATTQKIQARQASEKVPSWIQLYREWNKTQGIKEWKDMTGKEKTVYSAKKVLQVIGIVGACVVAADTVGTAIAYGEDDRKRDDKTIWNWLWDTSIPGATANMVAKWFGHGRDFTKESKSEQGEAGSGNATKAALTRQVKRAVGTNAEYYDYVGKIGKAINDEYAASHDMMSRPANPQAEREWEKEVEKNMSNEQNKGGNSPKWYQDQGKLMDKSLLGTPNYHNPRGSINSAITPIAPTTASGQTGTPAVLSVSVQLRWGGSDDDIREISLDKAIAAIKAKNRYSTNYTKRDVVHLWTNLRLMYAQFALLRRAYKCLLKFEGMDKNVPYALFASMGLDYVTFQANMTQMRADMASLLAKMSVYPHVNMTIFDRTLQLFDYIYKDDKITHAQYYMYNLSDKQCYWNFAASTPAYAVTDIVTHSMGANATGMTYTNFINALNTIVNATKGAVVDEITASFTQALGTWTPKWLSIPSLNEVVVPEYNSEILMQFENIQIESSGVDNTTASLTAWTDGTGAFPAITASATGIKYLNVHKSNPSVDDFFIMSRALGSASTGSSYFAITTEKFVGWRIYYRESTTTSVFQNLTLLNGGAVFSASVNNAAELARFLNKYQLVAAFDWAPHIGLNVSYLGTSAFTGQDSAALNVDWATYCQATGTTNGDNRIFHDYINYGNYNLIAGFETTAIKKAASFNKNTKQKDLDFKAGK